MTSILEFLSKHYLIFDLITLFLIFSLIGYFVSRKKKKIQNLNWIQIARLKI